MARSKITAVRKAAHAAKGVRDCRLRKRQKHTATSSSAVKYMYLHRIAAPLTGRHTNTACDLSRASFGISGTFSPKFRHAARLVLPDIYSLTLVGKDFSRLPNTAPLTENRAWQKLIQTRTETLQKNKDAKEELYDPFPHTQSFAIDLSVKQR